MLCKIADLFVRIPEAGGLSPRCQEYLTHEHHTEDMTICPELYKMERWPGLSEEDAVYLESGFQFYRLLLAHSGLMLHASAVELDGRAYLFSAPSGTGKSTHTRLWQKVFGTSAIVFNDDKPALRRVDGKWFAYGTPWCGKDGINQNRRVPLAGICYLKRGTENQIRRLDPQMAVRRIIPQTLHKFGAVQNLDLLLSILNRLIYEIPIYEMDCLPNEDAAQLSYETMRRGAEEIGL